MSERQTFLRRTAALLLVGAASSALTAPPAVAAEGGSTIASAPHARWGVTQDGIGTRSLSPRPGDGRTFWHVRVRRGDRIDLTLKVASTNGCGTNQIKLFAPSVTDAHVRHASGIDATDISRGGPCYTTDMSPRRTTHWRIRSVPFHGRATLWLGVSSEAPTFSFVAHVHHRAASAG